MMGDEHNHNQQLVADIAVLKAKHEVLANGISKIETSIEKLANSMQQLAYAEVARTQELKQLQEVRDELVKVGDRMDGYDTALSNIQRYITKLEKNKLEDELAKVKSSEQDLKDVQTKHDDENKRMTHTILVKCIEVALVSALAILVYRYWGIRLPE